MSEEIRKKIDDESERRHPSESIEIFNPETNKKERERELEKLVRRSIFREGAEFGYQLGYEEAMKELTRQAIDANSYGRRK